MKSFFLFLLGPLLLSQTFQTKDSLKTLALSNFKSVEVFENKNGKLVPTRNYNYNQKANEITIINASNENKEWAKTIFKLDNNYTIREEEKIMDGNVVSEKGNFFRKKQLSMITKYSSIDNTLQVESYDSNGKLSRKEFKLLDSKGRIIENLILLNIPNDIVVAEIEKYDWIDDKSYNYEKLTFNAPKSKVVGLYKLNQYGDRESFQGYLYIQNSKEDMSTDFDKKINKFDLKGNLIQVYKMEDGKQILLEERKITY